MNKNVAMSRYSKALFATIIVMSKFNCVAYWIAALMVTVVASMILTDNVYLQESAALSTGMEAFLASVYLICCGFFFMGFILCISGIYILSLASKDIICTDFTSTFGGE